MTDCARPLPRLSASPAPLAEAASRAAPGSEGRPGPTGRTRHARASARRALPGLALAAWLVAGCGGGGGSAAVASDPPAPVAEVPAATPAPAPAPAVPKQLKSLPVTGARNVAVDSPITVTFDLPLDPASVKPADVVLTGPAGPVAGTAAAVGTAIVFSPGAPLQSQASYTLRIAPTVKTVAGGTLGAASSVSFTTESGAGTGGSATAPAALDPAVFALAMGAPADGATGVRADATPMLAFTQALDPASATAGRFTLTGPAGPVTAGLTIDGSTATLAPAAGLVWGTRYTLDVAASVAGAGGQALGTPARLAFATRMPTWDAIQGVQTQTLDATGVQPVVAIDPAGNLMAAWSQYDPATTNYFAAAARYDATAAAWTAPQVIQAGTGDTSNGQMSTIALALDGAGNGLAVWAQWDAGSTFLIKANRYDATAGTWGTAATIQSNTVDFSTFPVMAMDRSGNAIAVWVQTDVGTGLGGPMSARFDATSKTWGTPMRLAPASQSGSPATITMDDAGNAIVVWSQDAPDFANRRVFARRYLAASGWEAAATQIQSVVAWGGWPVIAGNGAGEAVVAWTQWDNGTNLSTVAGTRFHPATGWEVQKPIQTASADSNSPVVAIDPAGNATAMWLQKDAGTGNFVLTASRSTATGWGPPSSMQDTVNENSTMSTLAADPAGNLLAAWSQRDTVSGYYLLRTSRFDASTAAWSAPATVPTGGIASSYPALTFDRSGNATMLFGQAIPGAGYALMARRFTAK